MLISLLLIIPDFCSKNYFLMLEFLYIRVTGWMSHVEDVNLMFKKHPSS